MPNLNVITDIEVQKRPLCAGSGLLRGFWHPLGSRSASPTDGAGLCTGSFVLCLLGSCSPVVAFAR